MSRWGISDIMRFMCLSIVCPTGASLVKGVMIFIETPHRGVCTYGGRHLAVRIMASVQEGSRVIWLHGSWHLYR